MAEQKKLSGVAIGLMAFGPFVLYGVASGFNHWRVATGGGLVLCLIFLAVRLRRGIPTRLMDCTTLTFFVIGSVLMIGLRSTVFPAYNVVVIWSCFAVAAWKLGRDRPSVHHCLRPRKRAARVLGSSDLHPA